MTAHRTLEDLLLADYTIPDPGDEETVAIDRNFAVLGIETGADTETRVLAQPPAAGLQMTVHHCVDGGGAVVVTQETGQFNEAGNTQILMNNSGQSAHLIALICDTVLQWRILSADGATPAGP